MLTETAFPVQWEDVPEAQRSTPDMYAEAQLTLGAF